MRTPKVKTTKPEYVLSEAEVDVIGSQVAWLRCATETLKQEFCCGMTDSEALRIAAQMLVARSGDRLEMAYTGPDEIPMDY